MPTMTPVNFNLFINLKFVDILKMGRVFIITAHEIGLILLL